MKTKQYYDCFPEYPYNTAFGSLLNGVNSSNSTINNDLIGIGNNSACNINSNSSRQSTEEIVRILIDFLGEFLLYLSSIIECQQSYSPYQLQKILDTAERIHQLRSTLLIQINHINDDATNSCMLDLPSIGLTLHELACFIRSLCREQQSLGTIIEHPHTTILTQLLDRIEKMTKQCIDSANMNTNAQCCQYPVPVINSCLNSPQMAVNPALTIGYGSPCNESNICMPWSFFEQIRNSASRNDQIFGLMYGIKDENLRRKLGYRAGKHGSPRGARQKYKRDHFSDRDYDYDSDGEWIVSSTDGIISPMQKASLASTKEIFKMTDQKEETNGRRSHNSILSRAKTSLRRLGSSRSISQQQSLVNSKQSSPLFRTNSDIDKSMRLNSMHGSASNRRMTTNSTSSRTGELPITSMLDRSVSQRLSSRQSQQQPSDINREDDDKSARSLSFRSYGYQTPSKTTIKISRESSQSLSPVQSKSNTTRQSNISTLSPKSPSINDDREKKKSSSVARSESQRSVKESMNENPSLYQTHNNITDSTLTMTSHDNISSQSWEQRLASPSPTMSPQRSNSTHLSQNIRSPVSSKQPSLKTTTSESNPRTYSEHQIYPATSFMNETHGDISMLNMVERPQSAQGEENPTDPSIFNHIKERSTPQLSSINTYRQQSTSATNDDHAVLLAKIKKYYSPSVGDRKKKFYTRETDDLSLHSNQQGYFHKLINCFRRTNVDRSRYRNR